LIKALIRNLFSMRSAELPLTFGKKGPKRPNRTVRSSRTSSYVPPSQSDEALILIWKKLQAKFFPNRNELSEYRVVWSTRRQKRTLASCNLDKKRVTVAKELRHIDYYQWLEPLLYHEMCHAVIGKGVARFKGKRAWHGVEFRELERRHPGISALDDWIKAGGWLRAIRAERARDAHFKRKLEARY